MTKVWTIQSHLLKNLRKIIAEQVSKRFSKGEVVAIKTHMGEYGNLKYVRPPIVGLVVEELKKVGAKPFVFDTPVAYPGSRDNSEKYIETARRNGFTKETMGCPIKISDKSVSDKSQFLSKLETSVFFEEADGLITISHFKGHSLANFGGAIKNLAMGGVSKKTKSLMHSEPHPLVDEDCVGCGLCIPACSEKAISLKDQKAQIDYDKCFGCGACVDICPHNCIKLRTARLGRILSETAVKILNKFDKKKLLFVNVLMDISSLCDCMPICENDVGKIVAPDVGILVSDNALAIDKHSLKLVQEATKNQFGKLFKSKLDEQLVAAEDYGLDPKYTVEVVQ